MFGIHYLKSSPNQYIIHYQHGKPLRSGQGLSFFYYSPTSSIVSVPTNSADAPFIFHEMSADFQPLTLQGQLTYRIADPEKIALLLDYTFEASAYLSEDPEKLPQRLVNLAQVQARAALQVLPLRQAIHASDQIAAAVLERLTKGEAAAALGVEILSLSIQSVRPSPEMARALEAEAREDLLRQADLALYDRRNASVEQERRIKENELNTEIAVESKKRRIRETKVNADLAVEALEQQVRQSKLAGQIGLESERKRLVEQRAENTRTEADVQAYAVQASLRPLGELDPAVLKMISLHSADPRLMISSALKELAENAAKIGTLNITPDLLTMLMDGRKGN